MHTGLENIISKLYNFWQILRTNLWFVPAFVSILYVILTCLLYYLESQYLTGMQWPRLLFNGSIADAKSLINTLLSSMITMATLAISITMVVLSLAATQLGPRLIRTFMSDTKTKVFISLFFGSIASCFVTTIALHNTADLAALPQLTITIVFITCFLNLFVLLAFVHHVAQSSIADQVIIRVAKDLRDSLNRLTTPEDKPEPHHHIGYWPQDFETHKQHLYFERSGYVQHINYDHIAALAKEHNFFVSITFKAGHFLVQGEDGVGLYSETTLDEDLLRQIRYNFIIGQTRTPTQDIEYSIRHLVEIGLRAQSPGMDDNFTALTILDHLSACLAILFHKETPDEWFSDSEGHVRIWAKQSNTADIIFSAFDQMRHSARDKPDIVYHFLKKIQTLSRLAQTDGQKEGLKRQLDHIRFDLEIGGNSSLEMQKIENLYNDIMKNM